MLTVNCVEYGWARVGRGKQVYVPVEEEYDMHASTSAQSSFICVRCVNVHVCMRVQL